MSLAFWIVFYIAGVVISFYSFLKWGDRLSMNEYDYIKTTYIWSLFWVITTPALIYIFLNSKLVERIKKVKKIL